MRDKESSKCVKESKLVATTLKSLADDPVLFSSDLF